jgi:ParB family transcriptional regulator, chromosome partitioning protein
MSSKKRSLGRNLEALLGGPSKLTKSTIASEENDTVVIEKKSVSKQSSSPAAVTPSEGYYEIAVEKLRPGAYQPRRVMASEALEALAASIKSQGILQPIIIRALDKKRQSFEIIAGERRWRAAQLAGLKEVPVIERKMNDEEAMAIGLIENIQRENLNPIEEAMAFERLIKEFKLTHQEIGDLTGRSRSAISNVLRLLLLEQSVKALLENNTLDMGHARALLALSKTQQKETAQYILENSLSVRETEEYVKQCLEESVDSPGDEMHQRAVRVLDPDVLKIQDRLSKTLHVPVKLLHHHSGKGKFVVKYRSIQELEDLLKCFEPSL